MTEITVDPDDHRSTAVLNGFGIRRQRLHAFQLDRTTVRHQRQAFEKFFQGAPGPVAAAKTWPEATAKARDLIRLFATTAEAQDPRRQRFIANALDDLIRLCDPAKGRS